MDSPSRAPRFYFWLDRRAMQSKSTTPYAVLAALEMAGYVFVLIVTLILDEADHSLLAQVSWRRKSHFSCLAHIMW